MENNEANRYIYHNKIIIKIFYSLIIIPLSLILSSFTPKFKIKNNSFFINYNNLSFKISDIKYEFSYKYKKIKAKYNITIYDENKNLISPSELELYNNLHLFCNIKLPTINISINSLPYNFENKIFNCIEFLNINEKVIFGIIISPTNNTFKNSYFHLFNENIFNHNKLYFKNNIIFNQYFINNQNTNKIFNLKKLFKKYPNFLLKRNLINDNEWSFGNIFHHYFCFCKGENCLNIDIPQNCKYYFYIYILDNNKNIYKKTDYLFIDFIFKIYSPDDTYPVFKEMKKQGLPVHYITEKENIYKIFCYKIKKCLTIIPVNSSLFKRYGDFLEKYLLLFLKLKTVISAKVTHFHYISLLFYNIDYITYIAIGHGLCFFKDYLYGDYQIYGRKRNNKILLPNSNKVISLAKKYGWKNKDIIKMNFPRWDKYNNNYEILASLQNKDKIKTNSIFIMFTWRCIKQNKYISPYYHQNIEKLLKDDILNKKLINNKIFLYITFHRFIIHKYKKKFNNILKDNKYIQIINQNEISECLSKTQLIISDFSSVIFDLIYRRKPIIIFIPDSNDPNIKELYDKDYFKIIESLKTGKVKFENKYFTVKDTIKKIVYYINNNFTLEKSLKNFYDTFGLKKGNNIKKFIKYLKNIK